MHPRQIKADPEAEGQDSSGLSAIQPEYSNTPSGDNDIGPGLQLPNLCPTHPLPVIHDPIGSFFSSQFLSSEGTALGLSQDLLLYPSISSLTNLADSSRPTFNFGQLYSPRDYTMNNKSRNGLPSSSGKPRAQGGAGTGAGITKRQSRPSRPASKIISQIASQAGLGAEVSPGQGANQLHGFDIDLTGLDYPASGPSTMGLYGSTLNSSMNPDSFALSSYNPHIGVGRGTQQGEDYRNMSPVPKFDPDLNTTPTLVTPNKYESFGEEEEEQETKFDLRRLLNEATPTKAQKRSSLAQTGTSPAAAADTSSSPVDSPFDSPGHTGGGSSGGRQAPDPAGPHHHQHHQAHVPPNRIAEAGPVTHPDPEWRPYGVNHWHVFLREPTTLKYLSSTEIKDIREHCYELAKAGGVGVGAGAGGGGGNGDSDGDQPQPIAEGSPYTTADAQAVWRHCDAYIRRRSQVRNNQAARRSRQRKDAETRYWKAKALEYGAPDHEFNWDLAEESPPPPPPPRRHQQGAFTAPAAQARNRGHQGQGQGQAKQQQQQQQGEGQRQASGRRPKPPFPAKPAFNFNQPFEDDEDEKTQHDSRYDAFTGGF